MEEEKEVAAMVVVDVVVVVAAAMMVVIVVDSSRVYTRRPLAPSTILRFSITSLPRESHPQFAHDVDLLSQTLPISTGDFPDSRCR